MDNLPSLIKIPAEIVENLRQDFYRLKTYTKNEMEKVSSIKDLDSVREAVKFLNLNIDQLVGDNYYRHDRAYFPHVDAPAVDSSKYLHVVVPLEKTYTDPQYFVIFDQFSNIGPATWTGLLDVDINFDLNKQVKGYIKEEDVINYSHEEISDEFHSKYLPYPKDWYKGLRGNAFLWEPGTAIAFQSNRLHCTGKMPKDKKKLGITLKFKLDHDVY